VTVFGRTGRGALALLAVVAGCRAAGGKPSAPAPVAGTYLLTVCARTCDEAEPRTRRAEVLVSLYDAPVRGGLLADANGDVPRVLVMDDTNACLAAPSRTGVSFIGVQDTVLTVWKPMEDGRIEIILYRSPDAGTEAQVSIRPDGQVEGALVDWAAPGRPESVVGAVRGRRMGPPDPTACGLRRPS
jgi:hypothetical protein